MVRFSILAVLLASAVTGACISISKPRSSNPAAARAQRPSAPVRPLIEFEALPGSPADPMTLAQLAESSSASELLERVAQGGTAGLTALRTLAEAEDGYAYRGEVCALTLKIAPRWRGELLISLGNLFDRGERFGEQLLAGADVTCRNVLHQVITDPGSNTQVRELAMLIRLKLE